MEIFTTAIIAYLCREAERTTYTLGMAEFLDGRQACYFDSQGWGFLEFGRIWHKLLFAGFGL